MNARTRIIKACRRGANLIGLRQKKIFAIGFNKSGTSSLHALFEHLGRPSYHGIRWRDCDPRFLRGYDCFSDDIPRDLPKLDVLYPGSKFVLQVRDLESWVLSRLAHIERDSREVRGRTWDTTEYAIDSWIKHRNAYHLFVLEYFAERPDDLLIINFINDDSAATKLCHFLGHAGDYPRPRQNVNPNRKRNPEHVEMFERCVANLSIPTNELAYDLYCPSLESAEVVARFPCDTSKFLSRRETNARPPGAGPEK